MFRHILILLLSIFPSVLYAQNLPGYENVFVNDFADVLSPEAEAEIAEMLQAARDARDHEMTVLTIRSQTEYGPKRDIAAFGKDVFNAWGIGNAERNDGILLLVATEDREVRIALGSGYPARWDGIAKRIIDRDILPAFRSGDLERGIVKGTRVSLEQLDMSNPDQPKLSIKERAGDWLEERPGLAIPIVVLLFISVPLLPFILPFAIFGLVRGVIRRRPRKCPECSRIMLRLGDVQEDQYLTAGQILEEKLDAKDYGVWFCEHDEHLTIVGYPKWRSRHKACPNCGHHTYETRRTTLQSATYSAGGLARLDSECAHCGHRASKEFSTPRLERSTSSSSGGSSSSSSSFGGGSSSGGGASGSW